MLTHFPTFFCQVNFRLTLLFSWLEDLYTSYSSLAYQTSLLGLWDEYPFFCYVACFFSFVGAKLKKKSQLWRIVTLKVIELGTFTFRSIVSKYNRTVHFSIYFSMPLECLKGHYFHHTGVQRKNSRSLELKAADIAWRVKATWQIRDDWENGDTIPLLIGH